MSDDIIDGGMQIFDWIQPCQRPAGCLENTEKKYQTVLGQNCSCKRVSNYYLWCFYLCWVHFPRYRDKFINAKVFSCILMTCKYINQITVCIFINLFILFVIKQLLRSIFVPTLIIKQCMNHFNPPFLVH